MNILSNDIKVYPTSFRNDEFDRQSRINSEYNITSLVNRLTGRDAFVISGLDEIDEDGYLSKGELNISGYYFNILNPISISDLINSPTNKDVLRFKIVLETNSVDAISNLSFEELVGLDFIPDQANGRLGDDSSKSIYTGLELTKSNPASYTFGDEEQRDLTKPYKYGTTFYLPIFEYKDNTWKFIESSKLIFTLSQIAVSNQNLSDNGLSNNTSADTKTFDKALDRWLEENFIIDDGEI
jgi:hypothetical protein